MCSNLVSDGLFVQLDRNLPLLDLSHLLSEEGGKIVSLPKIFPQAYIRSVTAQIQSSHERGRKIEDGWD